MSSSSATASHHCASCAPPSIEASAKPRPHSGEMPPPSLSSRRSMSLPISASYFVVPTEHTAIAPYSPYPAIPASYAGLSLWVPAHISRAFFGARAYYVYNLGFDLPVIFPIAALDKGTGRAYNQFIFYILSWVDTG